jgi:hypothetical protein
MIGVSRTPTPACYPRFGSSMVTGGGQAGRQTPDFMLTRVQQR